MSEWEPVILQRWLNINLEARKKQLQYAEKQIIQLNRTLKSLTKDKELLNKAEHLLKLTNTEDKTYLMPLELMGKLLLTEDCDDCSYKTEFLQLFQKGCPIINETSFLRSIPFMSEILHIGHGRIFITRQNKDLSVDIYHRNKTSCLYINTESQDYQNAYYLPLIWDGSTHVTGDGIPRTLTITYCCVDEKEIKKNILSEDKKKKKGKKKNRK